MTKRSADTVGSGARFVADAEQYKPYPAYKDSGVEWLGKIPAHWKVKRLKHLAHISSGFTLPQSFDRYEGEHPVYGSNGKIGYCDKYLVTNQALAIGRVGASGTINVVPGLSWVSDNALVVRIVGRTQLLWLRYILQAAGLGEHAVKNAQPLITATFVCDQALATPTNSEQCAIAAFLDRETAKIDALVAKKERLIELLQEKRTALITRAGTKGLDPDVPMKDSGVEWLGAVPANWDLLALKRRWNVVDCKHLTVPFIGEGIPLASVRETQSFELDLRDAQRTTVEWYKTLIEGGRKPRRGDLIYCRNVSVGSASLVTGDDLFAMGQDVCLIRSSTENQRWLNYFLCSSAMSYQLASTLVGSTFNRINVAEVMTLLIPVPPRVEQDRIAQFLELETAEIDSLVAKVYEAINHLKELRTALVSAAVTGKIDVRDGAAQTPGIAS